MDIYKRFNLTKVINARGPATVLGSAKPSPDVRQAVADALAISVEMVDLQAQASRAIARFTGAEAGTVTGCTAAGISVAVAACMTGDNLARIKELPSVEGLKNEVIIQKGHIIPAGETPISQPIRLTGAKLVEIGEAADAAVYQLENAINDRTAAAVYVKGGRAEGPGMIPPRRFIQTCKARGVPVIVDDASGLHVRDLIAAGADLVIFSSQKWLGGPTAGLIAGRRDLVYACFLQENGIGRPMKVGKEGIVGAIAAMEEWENRDWAAQREKQMAQIDHMVQRLKGIPGVDVVVEQSDDSGSVAWVRLDVDPNIAKITAWEVNQQLAKMNPVVKTHDYESALGYFSLDPIFLDEGDEVILCDSILEVFHKAAGRQEPISDEPPTRLDQVAEIMRSWLKRVDNGTCK